LSEPWGLNTGWSRHHHFGLRREWLGLVLREPLHWRTSGGLGPRQVESLARWLRTTGLFDRQGHITPLYRLLATTWPEATLAWQILWINVAVSFPTARWYVLRMGLGEWDTRELRTMLQRSVPRLAPHTVSNAVLELAGLLERTPIGQDLGQGEVSLSRPRRVRREGLRDIATRALLYAAQQLFLAERRRDLPLQEDILWPWVIFGCPFETALPQLTENDVRWLAMDQHGLHCLITLEELTHVALF